MKKKKEYENLEAEEVLEEARKLMGKKDRSDYYEKKLDRLMKLVSMKAMENALSSSSAVPPPPLPQHLVAGIGDYFEVNAKLGKNVYKISVKTSSDYDIAKEILMKFWNDNVRPKI